MENLPSTTESAKYISSVSEIADTLCVELKRAGFIIQRYDAYSTESIYLKLDFGVCNSIRISNHQGKKYLKYRYNIGPHIKEYREVRDKFPRYYYRADKIGNLLKKILKDRDFKRKRYGDYLYKKYMRKNQLENKENKGFWKESVIIN